MVISVPVSACYVKEAVSPILNSVSRLSLADYNLFSRAIQRVTHTFALIHRLNNVKTLPCCDF